MTSDQYILCNAAKQPLSPHTLQPHNPQDPTIWMSQATVRQVAAREDLHIGFVFTEQDPYFFIDIDRALTSGGWSPLALDLCNRFEGCYIEVSQSCNGLHIIGSGSAGPHSCRSDQHLELYSSGRYCMLTGQGARGSFTHQANGALSWLISTYFRPSAVEGAGEWTTEPCTEWAGYEDDIELISHMLASKSAKGALTGRVSVRDLWEGRGTGDASADDAALCAHLAFWTGRDCERIDRIFRLSGLYRDKWDREDYCRRTVLLAVSTCTGAHKCPQPTSAPERYLFADAQPAFFAGCVYVLESHRVLTPDGLLLKPEQFKARYGGHIFSLDAHNEKTTRNAWEAFTESQVNRYEVAHRPCFRPETAPGSVVEEEGLKYVNIYVPIKTASSNDDVKRFTDHIAKLLPNANDQTILLSYMAACVQYPGVKFQWAPLLQGIEGNGKTLLISCLARAIGLRYTHLPNANDLHNKFNAWVLGKLFVGVEEIYVSDRREAIDTLKVLITNDRVDVQAKGVDQQTCDNRANFFLCSNHKDAIAKTRSDRRYCVFYSAQQELADLHKDGMTGAYFPSLYEWLRAGGYAAVTGYLQRYEITDRYNPAGEGFARAPDTSSIDEAVRESQGWLEAEIQEAIDEERPGFRGGWISTLAVRELFTGRRVGPRTISKALAVLGYESAGRVTKTLPGDAGKTRLYRLVGHALEGDPIRQYLTAQGLIEGPCADKIFGTS